MVNGLFMLASGIGTALTVIEKGSQVINKVQELQQKFEPVKDLALKGFDMLTNKDRKMVPDVLTPIQAQAVQSPNIPYDTRVEILNVLPDKIKHLVNDPAIDTAAAMDIIHNNLVEIDKYVLIIRDNSQIIDKAIQTQAEKTKSKK